MTEIQALSLPAILAGKDVIAKGKTGSGKTAAFGLGLLNKLNVKRFRIQTLVLCPTRELADQVAKEIRKLARTIHNIKVLTLCGGMPFGPQVGSLEHGAHIVVGTPGRIEDHLGRGTLTLKDVDTLILDEADRMLDMGFQDSLDYIVSQTPKNRQTLLFSATYPDKIQLIANRIMKSPEMVESTSTHDHASIEQHFYQIDESTNKQARLEALHILLNHYQAASNIVFCATKRDVHQVTEYLKQQGFSVVALHGDLEQKDRDQTLVKFANQSANIMVATDVAARGLDIAQLDAVFNYHIARDTEVHVHRIGRTGRAGSQGTACSLFSEKEMYKLGLIEDFLEQKIAPHTLPDKALLYKKPAFAPMVTLQIDGGKKQKVRPGDILGALTGEQGIAGSDVGKIQLGANWAYVAVKQKSAKKALKKLSQGKLKGRTFRVRALNT